MVAIKTTPYGSSQSNLCLRTLAARDMPAAEGHLLQLPTADRRARFSYYASDAAITAYARRIDPSRVILVGAFTKENRLIGLAEAHPSAAARAVEIGITVDPAFRCCGLGRRLVARAIALAFARGARSAQFNFAPWNFALAGLVNSLGGQINTPGFAEISRTANDTSPKAA